MIASSEEFGNLCSSIYDANSRAFSNSGRKPTEVWLGPKEAKILEEEIKRHHVVHGASPQVSTGFAATRANMEGIKIAGLFVQLMVKDGVRVGTTWPKQS